MVEIGAELPKLS